MAGSVLHPVSPTAPGRGARMGARMGAGLLALIIGGGLAVLPQPFAGGHALADMTDPILVSCTLPAKAALPADRICALLADRLARAYPGRTVRLADGDDPATLRLDLMTAAPRRLEARLHWAGADPGPARGTAIADADLDETAMAAFLDALIAATPPP